MTEHQNRVIKSLQTESKKQDLPYGIKIFKTLVIMTCMFALIIIIGLAVSLNYSNVEKIDQLMLLSRPWLGVWRLLLFLIVFGFWPKWSVLYAGWASMNTEQLELMLAYRWRMALWVLVMEAVFSQKILSHFVNQLQQIIGA